MVAGEAGFIGGVALTMCAITLVVSPGAEDLWGRGSQRAAAGRRAQRSGRAPAARRRAADLAAPSSQISSPFAAIDPRARSVPPGHVWTAASECRHFCWPVLSRSDRPTLPSPLSNRQGLAVGFVLLRVESLAEEGKL